MFTLKDRVELEALEAIAPAERTAEQVSRIGLLESVREDWEMELREMDMD